MPARAATKTGLSLTVEPRPADRTVRDAREERRARLAAWVALLVAGAAIAGHFLGPYLSD